MEWMNAIQSAVEYIEEHITDEITAENVSEHVYMSPFYFQKGFAMLCGFFPPERAQRLRNRACLFFFL